MSEIDLPALPEPTPGERRFHEQLVDSKNFGVCQERIDALRLARIGVVTLDPLAQEIALARWNRTVTHTFEQYTSAQLLWGVEGTENSEDD